MCTRNHATVMLVSPVASTSMACYAIRCLDTTYAARLQQYFLTTMVKLGSKLPHLSAVKPGLADSETMTKRNTLFHKNAGHLTLHVAKKSPNRQCVYIYIYNIHNICYKQHTNIYIYIHMYMIRLYRKKCCFVLNCGHLF